VLPIVRKGLIGNRAQHWQRIGQDVLLLLTHLCEFAFGQNGAVFGNVWMRSTYRNCSLFKRRLQSQIFLASGQVCDNNLSREACMGTDKPHFDLLRIVAVLAKGPLDYPHFTRSSAQTVGRGGQYILKAVFNLLERGADQVGLDYGDRARGKLQGVSAEFYDLGLG